ncbi:bifunctional 4-hydroxy-2-oxoglutarate aldolase/2-dehydro-3-deoxy-phosphogluconate aldolase [Abyssalbus ytuae]|uniref:Bifunctional 4-hydroxy-2-oxoglutarate aldolase/2-dehydro-3-deoxy-phosphogluconate aldolase n=1 Tax=Abyssalbus ytuae TaxID=2926907 RepID=A0A9E7D0F8_9FLAO|nr:bifunctional 4-hydroxy-2-oxoglutarate aldolase/2-dehydro-3-deoxy-phosphogluconate aldolase [Abyssalbus ytuae]UOB18385.1 bifunctional 4-hydroxy-2-oxoglutarate aldolase/2-dehydro-3-deoxy-phosphogluconate aldolase [Abyssalbus ytuae]
MRFSRIEVVLQMEATGLVPLFYHSRPEVAQRVVKACYDGGARLLEFTHRGLFAHEVFNELSKYCIEHCPGMILGVGSVSDAGTASHYMNMGACFVVTPAFREDIARVCNRRKVLWSPGCGSLTEINRAEELGCEVVKLFPGEVYGPEFIKSVKAPQPWTKIMPTGGVDTTEENLKGWFGAGATCVGMGSRLVTKDIVENRQYGLLEEKVREVLEIIKKIKK